MESPSNGTGVDLFDCWQGNRESIREYMRESSLEYAPPAWPLRFFIMASPRHAFLLPPSFLLRDSSRESPLIPYTGSYPPRAQSVGRLLTRKNSDTLHGFITAQGMPYLDGQISISRETPHVEALSYPISYATRVHTRPGHAPSLDCQISIKR